MRPRQIISLCIAVVILCVAILTVGFLRLRSGTILREPALSVVRGMEKRQDSIHCLWGRFKLESAFNTAAGLRARLPLPPRSHPNVCTEELAFDGMRFLDCLQCRKPLPSGDVGTSTRLDPEAKKWILWSDGQTATEVDESFWGSGSSNTSSRTWSAAVLRRQSAGTSGIGFHPWDLNRASSCTWLDLEGKYLPGLDVKTSPELLRAAVPTATGTETINGVLCEVLKANLPDRGPMRFWVAPSLGFGTVKTEQVRMRNEGSVRTAIAIGEFSDFEKHGGVWFPKKATWQVDVTFKDGAKYWDNRWTLTVEELRVNEDAPLKTLHSLPGIPGLAGALTGGDYRFVKQWMVIGPFPLEMDLAAPWEVRSNTVPPGFERQYAPEREIDLRARYDGAVGGPVRWKQVEADLTGRVDLLAHVNPSENMVAYGSAVVTAPKDMLTELGFGSNDGAKIWLNGKLIYSRHVGRTEVPNQEKLLVKLRAGRNSVLVKVENWGRNWGYCLSFRDPDGQLRFSAE